MTFGMVNIMNGISRWHLLKVGLLMAFLSQASCARENPLIGSWKWDNDKTLKNLQISVDASDEMRKSANTARRFVEGSATKLRSNMVLTYREDECEQVVFGTGGQVLSREIVPYRLVEVRKGFVVIDQFQKGGLVKLFRESDGSLYVEVQVGNYKYKDFFTKIN